MMIDFKASIIVPIIFSIAMSGCTNRNDAKKSLEPLGFSDIEVTRYKWFSCHKEDFYHTGFVAKNPQGITVYGTVCSGLIFKNGYVRFD